MNLFVGVQCPECVNEAAIRASGMRTLVQLDEHTRFNDLGSEVAGWLLDDEVDMQCGPPGCDGYSVMRNDNAATPNDGKARYANYGKGVMFWETDAQAEPFINDFQQLQSNDVYWMTDPNEKGTPGYGMPSSYGKTVDRMRFLDGMDGVRKPIWKSPQPPARDRSRSRTGASCPPSCGQRFGTRSSRAPAGSCTSTASTTARARTTCS